MIPPGLRHFFRSAKKDSWNSVSAGPTGSELSTMTTSKEPSLPCIYLEASRKRSCRRGSPNATAVEDEKNCLDTSTTLLSISHMVTSLTQLCLQTSLRTPPSPPPTMSTCSGAGCEQRGR